MEKQNRITQPDIFASRWRPYWLVWWLCIIIMSLGIAASQCANNIVIDIGWGIFYSTDTIMFIDALTINIGAYWIWLKEAKPKIRHYKDIISAIIFIIVLFLCFTLFIANADAIIDG